LFLLVRHRTFTACYLVDTINRTEDDQPSALYPSLDLTRGELVVSASICYRSGSNFCAPSISPIIKDILLHNLVKSTLTSSSGLDTRTGRPGRLLLIVGIGAATSLFMMNVIARLTGHRIQAKKRATSPESGIHGIDTLPIELWSLVIEYVILDQLGDAQLLCKELLVILKNRHVCRQFLSPKHDVPS
jgi:hypothetical protein